MASTDKISNKQIDEDHLADPSLDLVGALEKGPSVDDSGETHDEKAVDGHVTGAATSITSHSDTSPFANLSSARKRILLAVFCLASAIDITNVSALIVLTKQIAVDLGITISNVVWVIAAYSLAFGAFMPFAGRLSDLYPAQWVFTGGLVALAGLSLGCSFATGQQAFLVLRGFQGLVASMTIPSAYHLIVHLYTEPNEQFVALAIIGLAGAVSNSIGGVLGGVFNLASWRWLFRFMAILAALAAVGGVLIMPRATTRGLAGKWKRLDIIGVTSLTAALVLFVFSLTSGTIEGWTHPTFIAPFVLSFASFIFFFVWEAKIDAHSAMMPGRIWRNPNLMILAITALCPYLFWGPSQLGLANYWQIVHRESPLLVAAKLLPQGVAALVGGAVAVMIPFSVRKPKLTILGGLLSACLGFVFLIVSQGGHGSSSYWRWIFTGSVFGSGGMIIVFVVLNAAIVQSVGPEMSGIGGALISATLQVGAVLGLSVQSACFSHVNNNLANWRGYQYGFYFCLAWTAVTAVAIAIFFKPSPAAAKRNEMVDQA